MSHLLHTAFIPAEPPSLRHSSLLAHFTSHHTRTRFVSKAKIREIFMPLFRSTMTEGKIVSWVKSEGEKLSSTWKKVDLEFQSREFTEIPPKFSRHLLVEEDEILGERRSVCISGFCSGAIFWLTYAQVALASDNTRINEVYEIGELFELGIQLTYLLLLLALLGIGSFFVIRQVLVRRELDLSAKELQEQVRSGDASATELFELGAVMLRRKFYPAATKYLLQAIEKWDGDEQDLAQVYNALGVCYLRDEKIEKGIAQFEKAVKLQPGYVTAWNNLGDAYEKKNDFKSALKAFDEALLFDPNNKIARPRREAVKNKVKVYKGVSVKSKKS